LPFMSATSTAQIQRDDRDSTLARSGVAHLKILGCGCYGQPGGVAEYSEFGSS
jgi:hypothetical protein